MALLPLAVDLLLVAAIVGLFTASAAAVNDPEYRGHIGETRLDALFA
ncbi:hypothetical protein ACIBLA_22115 [Streptomyces sp. NPDC050433]